MYLYIQIYQYNQYIQDFGVFIQLTYYQFRLQLPAGMRIHLKLLTANLLQEIPTIALQINSTRSHKYLFNVTQQQMRFIIMHNLNIHRNMTVFFTKFDSDTAGQFTGFFLELMARGKGYLCKIYFNHGNYEYWKAMISVYGFRLLPFAFYNLQNGNSKFGVKDQGQIKKIVATQKYKHRFVRGKYSNQELKTLIGDPVDPSSFMQIKSWGTSSPTIPCYYKDQFLQIHPFTINTGQTAPSQILYNYVCKPLPHQKVNTEKLQLIKKQNSLLTSHTIQLFKSGVLRVNDKEFVAGDLMDREVIGGFAILHYASVDNIKQILNHPQLLTHTSTTSITTVIHIQQYTTQMILSPQFKELKQLFSPTTTHLVYNRHLRMMIDQKELLNDLLNIYHFRYTHFVNLYTKRKVLADLVKNVLLYYKQVEKMNKFDNDRNVVLYKPLHTLIHYPHSQNNYVKQKIGSLQNQKFQNLKNLLKEKKLSQQEQKYIKNIHQRLKKQTQNYNPLVIFLGTSSQLSRKLRNVSGIVLKLPKNKEEKHMNIIMDCGQGIYTQIVNHFGYPLFQQQLLFTRILFITHKHKDHCAGIFQIIAKRNKIIKDKIPLNQQLKYKIFLIIPEILLFQYDLYDKKVEKISQFCEVVLTGNLIKSKAVFSSSTKKKRDQVGEAGKSKEDAKANELTFQYLNDLSTTNCLSQQYFQIPKQNEQHDLQQQIKKNYKSRKQEIDKYFNSFLEAHNIVKFQPIPVIHCKQSFGVVFQHSSGVKISYSGDCRPTPRFQKQAKNSTLLIHEATFQDEQILRAKITQHSTKRQAIQVGHNTRSIITALTHFSQATKHKSQYQKKKATADKLTYRQTELNKAKDQERIKSMSMNMNNISQSYVKHQVLIAHDHLQFNLSQMAQIVGICKDIEQAT